MVYLNRTAMIPKQQNLTHRPCPYPAISEVERVCAINNSLNSKVSFLLYLKAGASDRIGFFYCRN